MFGHDDVTNATWSTSCLYRHQLAEHHLCSVAIAIGFVVHFLICLLHLHRAGCSICRLAHGCRICFFLGKHLGQRQGCLFRSCLLLDFRLRCRLVLRVATVVTCTKPSPCAFRLCKQWLATALSPPSCEHVRVPYMTGRETLSDGGCLWATSFVKAIVSMALGASPEVACLGPTHRIGISQA